MSIFWKEKENEYSGRAENSKCHHCGEALQLPFWEWMIFPHKWKAIEGYGPAPLPRISSHFSCAKILLPELCNFISDFPELMGIWQDVERMNLARTLRSEFLAAAERLNYEFDVKHDSHLPEIIRRLQTDTPSLMERMKANSQRRKGRNMIELYKDGTNLAIATECTEPGDFLRAASKAIAELIESKKYSGREWQQHLDGWLPQLVEITCKLKGYKAEVQETRRLIAGPVVPQEKALVLRHDGYRAEAPTNGAAKSVQS